MGVWKKLAGEYDEHLPFASISEEILELVLRAVRPRPGDVAVDMGAGTGFLTVPLAHQLAHVYAVDTSAEMLKQLRERLLADPQPVPVEVVGKDVRRFQPDQPVDVVVSNYALHHLRHAEKRAQMRRCLSWMSRGGRIAISDLSRPLTLRPGENRLLLHHVRRLARQGWVGYSKLGKHMVRWATGRGEYPATLDFWKSALLDAGFEHVDGTLVGIGSCVVWGSKP
jgi:cyclopropane fatty-acyl-phospholipid synthase-like methyltransferase